MIHRGKQQGFTLVELMLAIAFIGFIILFTVLAIIQIMRTYNKGITVKEINQTARVTLEDMTRAIRSSSTIDVTAMVDGRICTGGISYVWNEQGAATNKYDSTGNPAVTLARVADAGGAMCVKSGSAYPNVPAAQSVSLLTDRAWVQMLNVGVNSANNLATVTLQLSTPDTVTSPTLEDPFPGTPSDPADATTWVRCKGTNGAEFCATSTFSTTVALRGEE